MYIVVVNISKSKNESKSQHTLQSFLTLFVVVNISKSKNESKSQRDDGLPQQEFSCGQYQ